MGKIKSCIILMPLLLAGCSAEHVGTDLSSNLSFAADPALQARAMSILQTNCSGCHGTGLNQGGVSDILNVSHLIADGLITPGNPTAGRIIGSAAAGTMPPSGPIATQDLQALRDWVGSMTIADGGANPPITPPPPLTTTFESISKNIFQPKCVACHKTGGSEPEIRYDSYASAIATGKIKPGAAADSGIMDEIEKGDMPPADDGYPALSAEEISVIRQWINAGAPNN